MVLKIYHNQYYCKGGKKAKKMTNITEKTQREKTLIENADIIKRLLEVKHMSVGELYRRSGISKSQICKIMKRKVSNLAGMRLSTIHALSKALDVEPSVFIKAPYVISNKEDPQEEEPDDDI